MDIRRNCRSINVQWKDSQFIFYLRSCFWDATSKCELMSFQGFIAQTCGKKYFKAKPTSVHAGEGKINAMNNLLNNYDY